MDTMDVERAESLSPEVTVFRLKGPFVLGTMFELQAMFREPELKGVIVDLSEVPYIDLGGVGGVAGTLVAHAARRI